MAHSLFIDLEVVEAKKIEHWKLAKTWNENHIASDVVFPAESISILIRWVRCAGADTTLHLLWIFKQVKHRITSTLQQHYAGLERLLWFQSTPEIIEQQDGLCITLQIWLGWCIAWTQLCYTSSILNKWGMKTHLQFNRNRTVFEALS